MVRSFKCIIVAAVVLVSLFGSGALAGPIFYDNFESGLSAWIGKSGGAHNGAIVPDPLGGAGNALTFTAVNSGGDIFTTGQAFSLTSGRLYRVSFDFLGLRGQVPGGSGGFAGLSQGYPGTHMWYYGTNTTSGAAPILLDDGQWHSYAYEFIAPAPVVGNTVRLMFEDFGYYGYGIPGDAFVDNVVFQVVPAPGAVLLAGLGSAVVGWLRRRRAL